MKCFGDECKTDRVFCSKHMHSVVNSLETKLDKSKDNSTQPQSSIDSDLIETFIDLNDNNNSNELISGDVILAENEIVGDNSSLQHENADINGITKNIPPCHKLAIKDIISLGYNDMKKKNYGEIRQRKKQRIHWNNNFITPLYESIISDNNDTVHIVKWLQYENDDNSEEGSVIINHTQKFRTLKNKYM